MILIASVVPVAKLMTAMASIVITKTTTHPLSRPVADFMIVDIDLDGDLDVIAMWQSTSATTAGIAGLQWRENREDGGAPA